MAKVKIGHLTTIKDIRIELAKLYRDARQSIGTDITPSSASKLAYLLGCLSKTIHDENLEQRVTRLEGITGLDFVDE